MAKGQGWHGQSKRHAEAAKGNETAETTDTTSKSSGWFGESKEHSKAAKGKKPKSGGLMDKL
jgi:hypothetical protein